MRHFVEIRSTPPPLPTSQISLKISRTDIATILIALHFRDNFFIFYSIEDYHDNIQYFIALLNMHLLSLSTGTILNF